MEGYTQHSNIRTISADLSQIPLKEVLNGYTPDVIDFTGAYFTPTQLTQAAQYMCSLLSPQGALVVYVPWLPGLREVQAAARFFKQQVGDLPASVESEYSLRQIFTDAGYRDVQIVFPSHLAKELAGLATPVLDVEVLVIARK